MASGSVTGLVVAAAHASNAALSVVGPSVSVFRALRAIFSCGSKSSTATAIRFQLFGKDGAVRTIRAPLVAGANLVTVELEGMLLNPALSHIFTQIVNTTDATGANDAVNSEAQIIYQTF